MRVTNISVRYNEDVTVETPEHCSTPELLAPEANCTPCEVTYAVTQDDLDRGFVKAYILLAVEAPWEYLPDTSGWDAQPEYTPADKSAEVPAAQSPFVAIEQIADPNALAVGELGL